MKILYSLPQIYPYQTGGAEIFHYHLMLEASKKHTVYYVGHDDIKSLSVNFIKVNKLKPIRIFVPLQIIYFLIKNKKNYEIIHLNYSQGSWVHWFYFPILKYLYGIKYGITIHDSSKAPWKAKRIFKNVFETANFVVAVSEDIKADYERRCNRPIVLIPPLVPLKQNIEDPFLLLSKYGLLPEEKIVLFVGSLKELKRPLLLIEALNKLGFDWLKQKKIKVIIAGEGPLMPLILEMVGQLGLSGFISLVGGVPNERINEFYRISSIFVMPSIREGTSLALIEAMFNKLGIIASNVQGINSMIRDHENGLLFEADNACEFADKIKLLIENPDFADKLGQKSFEDFSKRYNYQDMINEYLELYKT